MDEPGRAAVLLVAHGSRITESNSEIADLAARLAAQATPDRAKVAHAFLELAQPSIPDAIDELAGAGVDRLLLVPYFLTAGRHVGDDIPAIVEAARRRHPGLDIRVTQHFGGQPGVPELLLNLVSNGFER